MEIPTTKQIIIRIVAIIALVELGIMILFVNIPFAIGSYAEVVLDVIILVVLSTPIIYIWIIKPYVVARDEAVIQINLMAYQDPLTQLANRRMLAEYLEKLISSNVRRRVYGALLFIDLDGFKRVNDNNGHDAGDAILIEVATRLSSYVRTEDIVSRIGGDEFVVVMNTLDSDKQVANEKALLISERIHLDLKKSMNFKNVTFQIDASIGLRLLAPEKTSVESVLKDADEAMYCAKQAGKGGIVVSVK